MTRRNVQTCRSFVAIAPPPEAVETLARKVDDLREQLGDRPFRWVSHAGLHVTLHFLGDVDTVRIHQLSEAIGAAGARCPRFDLHVDGIGVFPNQRQPRVVWSGFADTTAITVLHAEIGAALETRGFPVEDRSFTPHLTLGRVRRGASKASIREFASRLEQIAARPICRFSVPSITLFRSELRPEGPLHTVLARAPLANR